MIKTCKEKTHKCLSTKEREVDYSECKERYRQIEEVVEKN